VSECGDGLVRKVRLDDVCRVGFDAVDEVIVGWVEQFGDGQHVIAAVAEPCRATRSVAELIPDQAGAAYWMRETTIARNMSCSDVVGVPCERRTRIATRWQQHSHVVTRWMFGHGGGGAPSRHDEKTISFVLLRFSFRLLSAAHVCIWSISSWHVSVLTPGTTRYICVVRDFEDPVPVVNRMQVSRGDDVGGGPYLSPSLE